MIKTFLALLPVALRAECTGDWKGEGDACFFISEEPSTFVQCQRNVCAPMGGTLASIRTPEEERFVEALMAEEGAQAVFVGFFEAGLDESQRWQFVDGTAMPGFEAPWAPGQPDENCGDFVDEDCAVLAPSLFGGWVDSSCAQPNWAKCLCREGGTTTIAYDVHEEAMEANEYDYFSCFGQDGTCEAIGIDPEYFLPYKEPYLGSPTCQALRTADDADDADVKKSKEMWSWCCCGVESACCSGTALEDCAFAQSYETFPYAPVEDPPTAAACPGVFEGPTAEACFYVTPYERSFVECEEDVCEPLGGTLAAVRSELEYNYLARVLGDKVAFLGGYEAGLVDESGNWIWVDGGVVDEGWWAQGQPDNFCNSEDCLGISPSKIDGFFDTSCAQALACVCRFGGYASPRYYSNRPNLLQGTTDYDGCDDTTPEEGDDTTTEEGDDGSSDGSGSGSSSGSGADPAAFCGAYGYDEANFAPYLRAYPAEDPLDVKDLGGYSEGLCGYAAAEDDGTWATCCCDDRDYCCPQSGASAPDCKSTHRDNACPLGYSGPDGGGCFKVSEVESSFVGCQDYVCGPEAGAIASLRSIEDFSWVRDLLDLKDAAGWVGLYEYGEDESGDWRWVDGSTGGYVQWTPGEPNQICGVQEDCAALAPDLWPGLIDASCAIKLNCVCRAGTATDDNYQASVPNLASADPDYDELCDDDAWVDDDDDDKEDKGQIIDRLASVESEVTALLVLFCLTLAGALVLLCLTLRPYLPSWASSGSYRRREAMPAYGLELGETIINPAYDSLVRDDSCTSNPRAGGHSI